MSRLDSRESLKIRFVYSIIPSAPSFRTPGRKVAPLHNRLSASIILPKIVLYILQDCLLAGLVRGR